MFFNFENFTGKHLCWNIFLIKLQAFRRSGLSPICRNFSNIFWWNSDIIKPWQIISLFESKLLIQIFLNKKVILLLEYIIKLSIRSIKSQSIRPLPYVKPNVQICLTQFIRTLTQLIFQNSSEHILRWFTNYLQSMQLRQSSSLMANSYFLVLF